VWVVEFEAAFRAAAVVVVMGVELSVSIELLAISPLR